MKKQLFFITMLVIFGLSANAQYTKLLDFNDTTGMNPYGSLLYNGNYLYGMCDIGGDSVNDNGTLFRIMTDGSLFSKLLDFTTGGESPLGSLISDGTWLYGMTSLGGSNNDGTVFKIMLNGSGFANLFDFADCYTNGCDPSGSLVSDGNFMYGMTHDGGINNNDGTIFKILSDGTHTKLLDFAGAANGKNPGGDLLYNGGYLYGMTEFGGVNDKGTIFKISTAGSGYVKLLDFAGTSNGSHPKGSLIFDGTFLYGMTMDGGTNDEGTVFKIKPDGSGYTKLFDFAGITNGQYPEGSLISVGSFLYGMTSGGGWNFDGCVFKIKPDGSGYERLLDFDAAAKGSTPYGTLAYDGTSFYGMTNNGGTNDAGVIFKLTVPTSIDEIDESSSFSVFPNPATNSIEVESPRHVTIEISNIEGQIIKRLIIKDNKTNIDISEFSSGVYIIKATTDKGITIKKFIKE